MYCIQKMKRKFETNAAMTHCKRQFQQITTLGKHKIINIDNRTLNKKPKLSHTVLGKHNISHCSSSVLKKYRTEENDSSQRFLIQAYETIEKQRQVILELEDRLRTLTDENTLLRQHLLRPKNNEISTYNQFITCY